jgi:hypothetical protein
MKLAAILLLAATSANAADAPYCESYATKSIDAVMKYMWLRLYSTCTALPETPVPLASWKEFSKRVSEANQLPDGPASGSVPATGVPQVKRVVAIAPKTKASAPSPAEVCARVHKRIVSRGKSWRCQ